ncbi:MAG: tetratricopeptide repeat protein, partial [Verrucomicrobiota bacterium]
MKKLLLIGLIGSIGPMLSAPAQNPLVAGRAALEDGLHELAEKSFRRHLDEVKEPARKVEVVLYLVEALAGQGKQEDALTLLTENWESASTTTWANAYVYWTARAHYERGAFAAALKALDGIKDTPDDPHRVRTLRMKSKCLVMEGRNDEALVEFETFQVRFAETPEAPGNLLDWASVLLATDKAEPAANVLDRLIKDYATSPEASTGRLWLARVWVEA